MAARLPEQSYYPRARLRLGVRFEDYGDADTPPAPKVPPQNRGGAKHVGQPGALNVVTRDGRLLLEEPGGRAGVQPGSPQDQTRSDDGRTFVVEGVIPISAQLQLNGVRQADALTAVVQYRDFPFDPRAIRSCWVKFFLGCVSADDAARGAAGEIRQDATEGGDALPFSAIPDRYVDRYGRPRTNLRFEGWVDVERMKLSADSLTVQFECTDNTALLIDQPAPPRLTVGAKAPIDRAVATYLASFPQFAGLSVEYRPATDDANKPVLGKVLQATAHARKDQGPGPGANEKITVWDYLTDVVGHVGHTVRIEGTVVVIQRARTLMSGRYSRPDDPFTGRRIDGADGAAPLLISTRMYSYGVNVQELAVERGWRRRETGNVEVRSYSTSRKKTLIVRFPEKGDRVKSLKPGQQTELKFEVVRVRGIDDLKTLKIIAQNYYEARNRNEIGVTVDTPNLGSFGGDNLDPDALDLREGDAVRIEVARPPDDVDDTAGATMPGAVATYERLGFPRDLAEAASRAMTRLAFPNTFKVRQAAFDWDNESGVAIKLGCVNYVEVRVDKDLPDDPTPPGAADVEPVRVSAGEESG